MRKFLEHKENSALLRQKWALMMNQLKYNYVISNAFISNYLANIQTLRGNTPCDPEWRRVDNELFYRADHLRNASPFPRLIKWSHVRQMITAEPVSSKFIVSALLSANGLQLFTHDDDESGGTRVWNWLQLDMVITRQHSNMCVLAQMITWVSYHDTNLDWGKKGSN